jgi:hypothetical protein
MHAATASQWRWTCAVEVQALEGNQLFELWPRLCLCCAPCWSLAGAVLPLSCGPLVAPVRGAADGGGDWVQGCIVDVGEIMGLITKKGAWYSYGETK